MESLEIQLSEFRPFRQNGDRVSPLRGLIRILLERNTIGELAEISPRLLYLRVMPQENGAELFYWGPSSDDEDNATAKSATRRRLVKEGKYVPTCYYLVWLRQDILKWAKARREVLG